MSYQVLARKWRPRRFADLVGQDHVARALINALDHDRLHHAFLFTGTRGVGKTTIARILAKSLNCETGVSSQPCGSCATCREVDEGRFVDLIEVDAASRTKVDDTRELLDNVQYAPTRGRYKVYLIDEVHMLSGHSFNALLKTLEEPPPHVKFLLATTDPQKLPVTVLSRCLQFHLKRLSPELIRGQLHKILDAEGIAFDAESLALLAQSADGSMRDALSLLDQAIAFGGGRVSASEVRDMLGAIDDSLVEQILSALVAQDAERLLAAANEAYLRNADPDNVLGELLRALHRIAVMQALPADTAHEASGDAVLREPARQLSPEDVQLFYQIALIGRRDLFLAADARSGLDMVLLRMLAFRPAVATTAPPGSMPPVRRAAVSPASVPAAREPQTTARTTAAVPPPVNGESWGELVAALDLTGLVRELANHTVLERREAGTLHLTLDQGYANLLNKEREQVLGDALGRRLGEAVTLRITLGQPAAETPAREKQRVQSERQQAATAEILGDPGVQALQEQFGARVNLDSIRPKT